MLLRKLPLSLIHSSIVIRGGKIHDYIIGKNDDGYQVFTRYLGVKPDAIIVFLKELDDSMLAKVVDPMDGWPDMAGIAETFAKAVVDKEGDK